MKAQSPFVARIRRGERAIIASAPEEGRLFPFADVGGHLEAMPRHAAYLTAMLDGPERKLIPWHRAVAADRKVEKPAPRAALDAQGHTFDPDGRVSAFLSRVVAVTNLSDRVAPQKCQPDAPFNRQRHRP